GLRFNKPLFPDESDRSISEAGRMHRRFIDNDEETAVDHCPALSASQTMLAVVAKKNSSKRRGIEKTQETRNRLAKSRVPHQKQTSDHPHPRPEGREGSIV